MVVVRESQIRGTLTMKGAVRTGLLRCSKSLDGLATDPITEERELRASGLGEEGTPPPSEVQGEQSSWKQVSQAQTLEGQVGLTHLVPSCSIGNEGCKKSYLVF